MERPDGSSDGAADGGDGAAAVGGHGRVCHGRAAAGTRLQTRAMLAKNAAYQRRSVASNVR